MNGTDTGPGTLAHLRVLVAGTGRTALTTGAILADDGADVAVLEPPGGHPLRGWLDAGTGRSLAWAAIARNTSSVIADPDDPSDRALVDQLLAAADVLLVDPGSRHPAFHGPDLDDLRRRHPRLVIVAVSPYGRTGPRSHEPASDIAAEALGGLAHITGHPDRAPLHSDYPVATAATALFAAFATTAALLARDRHGTGALVDLASVDVITRILDFVIAFHDQLDMVSERSDSTSDYQVPVNRWQTADGRWLSFTGNTNDIVLRFLRAIGRPDLCDDERFATNAARVEHRAELEAIIEEHIAAHTRDALDEAMVAERVPIAVIVAMDEIFHEDQYRSRGVITTASDDHGEIHLPSAAMRRSHRPGRIRHAGPALGADTERIRRAWTPTPEAETAPDDDPPPAPLTGLRVLDIGNVIAGPLCATLLADLGADVIKVERPRTGDLFRAQAPLKDGGSPWWRVMGRGKRSIALDLKDDHERAILHDLARDADIIIENMVPGVVESLGVDHPTLARINPGLVGVSISGYGQDGPMSRRPAFGRNAEAYGGMAYITGYPGERPQHTGFPVADSFSALLGAYGALSAVLSRDRTDGRGQHVDVALFESVFRFLEPQTALHGATGEVWERARAASDPMLWRRCVPTADGRWLSLSLTDDADIDTVARWADLSTEDLLRRPERLDDRTRTRTLEDLAADAHTAGIAAVPTSTAVDLTRDPHLVARGVLTTQDDHEIGTMVMPAVSPVLDGTRPVVQRPAPLLDAHRHEILAEIDTDDAPDPTEDTP